MVRSTFLGASQPPSRSFDPFKDSFVSSTPTASSSQKTFVVTPDGAPRSPGEHKDEGPASISTAGTSSSTDAIAKRNNNNMPQEYGNNNKNNDNNNISISRDGPEATIQQLQRLLDESSQRDEAAKVALAKSDTVILDLRSSVRQLKRELERAQNETSELQQMSTSHESLEQAEERHASEISSLKQAQSEDTREREQYVAELQLQLDRAHGQLLTADMVRQELEDMLEAEQYTWELRVQDQERTISSLQQECETLQKDLNETRSQWQEAEKGWSTQLKDLGTQLESTKRELNRGRSPSDEVVQLRKNIGILERDRSELQSCLDEAMHELEAVDAEIQAAQAWRNERDELLEENQRLQAMLGGQKIESPSPIPLINLVKWLRERPIIGAQIAEPDMKDSESMISFVRDHIEALQLQLESAEVGSSLTGTHDKIERLEKELAVCQSDLKAREESSAELRTSLKEAVALLKPLQEVVDKTEREKDDLGKTVERLQKELEEKPGEKDLQMELETTKNELSTKEQEIQELKKHVESLQHQLKEYQDKAAAEGVTKGIAAFAARSVQPSNEEGTEEQRHIETNAKLEKARKDLRAKRDSERALRQMLLNAQNTFSKLNQQNEEVANENIHLQEKLSRTEKELQEKSFDSAGDLSQERIQRLENDVDAYAADLKKKEEELTKTKGEMEKLKEEAEVIKTEQRWSQAHRVEELETELSKAKADVKARKEAEHVLASSLKEALGLLHPLQEHLETAEKEKKKLSRELKASRRKLERLDEEPGIETASNVSSAFSRSLPASSDDHKRSEALERMVENLQLENGRLQDALEDASTTISVGPNGQSQHRLKQNYAELEDMYEESRQRLEDAKKQKSTLLENLSEKDRKNKELNEEIVSLRDKLQKSNEELENAKYIATSALVKVEEMAMASVEKSVVDLTAEDSQLSRAVVEKEIRDLSRTPKEHEEQEQQMVRYEHQESPEVRNLKSQLQALELEVRNTKEINASLEETVRSKDRRLKSLAERRSSARRPTDEWDHEIMERRRILAERRPTDEWDQDQWGFESEDEKRLTSM